MAAPKWNREKALVELEILHSRGIPLTNLGIMKNHSGLYYAIHNEYPTGKLFGSIREVRETLASRYESRGMYEDAVKIRSYNCPQKATNKFTVEDWKKRREELIERLKQKIEREEDVSIRTQYKTDRSFAGQARRAFGTYGGMFNEAGLNYLDHARHLNRKPDYYLKKLVIYLKSGVAIDRISLLEVDKKLVERLSTTFEGYYSAVREAKKMLEMQGNRDLASRIDAEDLRQGVLEERKKRSLDKRNQALEKIVTINPAQALELKQSGEWLTTAQIAGKLDCSESNVYKNLILVFPDKVRRHSYHDKNTYLYHCSIIDSYKNKNVRNSPTESINKTSKRLGISYSKARSIMHNLGIGKRSSARHIQIGEDELAILEGVLEREKRVYASILQRISPDRTYTFRELEIMGIPISFFDKAIRNGDLPRNGSIRSVDGTVALNYFKEKYRPERHLSQGMRLVTHFNSDLYTISDLIPLLKKDRTTVGYRLDRLLEENPEACFRIRKNERNSKIISSKEILPFLANWEVRHDLQLVKFLSRSNNTPLKNEVLNLLREADQLANPDFSIENKKNALAFNLYHGLGVYQKQMTEVDGVAISKRNLHMLYHYMDNHDYDIIELGKRFSLRELKDILDEDFLLDRVTESKKRLGWALFRSNEGLAVKVIQKKGLDIDRFMGVAQDALLNSIDKFDPTLGFKFSTYAWRAIERRIETARKDKYYLLGVSLDEPIGNDARFGDFMEAKDESEPERLGNSEVSDLINEVLSDLDNMQKKVINGRFGLNNVERKTLEEIAKDSGLTRERIRQIEKKALEKMSYNPRIKLLKDAFKLDD